MGTVMHTKHHLPSNLYIHAVKPLYALSVPHFSILFFAGFNLQISQEVSKPVVFFIQPLYRSWNLNLRWTGSSELQPSGVRLTSEMENQYCKGPSLAI